MSAPSDFEIPARLGRYQLGVVIGVGGFAVVVRAWDEGLEADVAVKILNKVHAADPEIRERFVREARLIRRVRNSSVIGVHDVGETEDGRPYFIMDLAAGGTLEDRLADLVRPAATDDLRMVVAALGSGLGALHAVGVVHRDVKPANLLIIPSALDFTETGAGDRLLVETDRLVLGDLGLAKDIAATELGPTMVGGTPRYRAPEQMEVGAAVDERTDVYACTAVLWRLLTGGPPPTAQEVPAQLEGAPAGWRTILLRGMAERPDDRFASMAEWVDAVNEVLEGSGGSSVVRAASAGVACPYKGLAAYQATDSSMFFGRSRLVDELVARLQGNSTLVIAGPSGSGKSSLMRAGLLPALAQGALVGSQNWRQCLLTPGAHPLGALWAGLATLTGTEPADLVSLKSNPAEAAEAALKRAGVEGGVVAIDQFEELFTAGCDRTEREAFLGVLERLSAGDPPRLRVVICIRADFYGACAAYPWTALIINRNQVLVGPMGRAGLREAIEGPARRVGLRLEDGLADRILDDAGSEAGALPLLAHALVETWIRRQGRMLTFAGYEAAGGVAGALSRTAEEVWGRFDEEQRAAARRLILRLVHPGEGAPDTRRRAGWEEIGDDKTTADVVAALADARLVTTDDRGVELGHEALIGTWGRLASWLEESRDELRTRERLMFAAREWQRQDRDPDLLLRGVPLAAALEWRAALAGPAGEPLDGFLADAEAARDALRQAQSARVLRQRRASRRTMVVLGSLTAVALVASVIALTAFARSRADAQRAADQLSRNLASLADRQVSTDPYLASMLAVESLARLDLPLVEARDALVEARRALGGDHLIPYGDPLPVGDALTVAVDPAGETAAVGDRDGSISLWDLATLRHIADLTGPTGGVQDIAFSADGSWLVATGDDRSIWRWSLEDPVSFGSLLAELGSILWSVAVSPDGESIAAATQVEGVWLLDAGTGEPQGEPLAGGEFLAVAFSPDGNSLLAADGSGRVSVWSLPERSLRFPVLAAHNSDIWEIVTGVERSEFLTVSSDGTARLWDLNTGARKPGGPYDGSEEAPLGLSAATLTPGGESVTMGGPDGTLHAWSFTEQRFTAAWEEVHTDAIIDSARSADGTILVTLSNDHTARVFHQTERPGALELKQGPGAGLYAIDVNGPNVAVGTDAGEVVVVDSGTGQEMGRLPGHEGRVFALVFDAEGRVITGDSGGTLRRWDWQQQEVLAEVAGAHEGAVNAVAVGRGRIASAGADSRVRLWDSGLRPVGDPLGPLGSEATDVVIARDGVVVAATRAGVVARWNRSGRPVGEPFQAETSTIWSVALDPEGRTMALATDDEAVVTWSLGAEPARLESMSSHRGGTLDVVFVDPWTLAASSRAGEVRLWDAATGRALGPPLASVESPIWHLTVADGGVIWGATQEGSLVRIDALMPQAACRIAQGAFDERQQRRFLGAEQSLACR